jgi:quercetin dioxygenase-like cupin family protein
MLKDKQIDVNNHKDSYMLIQDFVKHHIDGATLLGGIVTECPECSTNNIKTDKQMTIKKIKEELNSADRPVAKSLHHGPGFKVLIMGFKKGMILIEHKAHLKSKLTVLEGAVIYKEATRVVDLGQYDEVEIPVEITHSVEAVEDSLCILTQGE